MILLFFLAVPGVFGELMKNSTYIYEDARGWYYKDIKARTKSLIGLFNLIKDAENLEQCNLNIVYDSGFDLAKELNFPMIFRRAFNTMIYTQEDMNLSNKKNKYESKMSGRCRNYLLLLKTVEDITKYFKEEPKSKIIIISTDTTWGIKNFLKSYPARYLTNLLIVAHSMSSKAQEGSYLFYTHELFAEANGATQPVILGSWINYNFTRPNTKFFPDKLRRGFQGHRIIISAVVNAPFVWRRTITVGQDKEIVWDGIEIRLFNLMSHKLNLTTEYVDPQTSHLSDGDAAKKDVELGLTSGAMGGIYHTADINRLVDVSDQHSEDCASFVSLTAAAIPKYHALLGPFQLSVWLAICVTYLLAIIPLALASRYPLLTLITKPGRFNKMFWYMFSYYTNSFTIKDPTCKIGKGKNAMSIFIAMYWLFTIIITACYTGSIVAFITFPVYPPAIENSHQLLEKKFRIGTLNHDGWEKWFNGTTEQDPQVKKLFKKIEHVPSVYDGVTNASVAFFWPYAFLGSRAALDFIVQTDFAPSWGAKRTLMHISNECFVRFNVVFLMQPKSMYLIPINKLLRRVIEMGFKTRAERDIDAEIQRTAMKLKKQVTKGFSLKVVVEDRKLTVEDTLGMIFLLVIGYTLAGIVIVVEALFYFIKKRYFTKPAEDDQELESYWGNESLPDSSEISDFETKWRRRVSRSSW